MLGVRSGTKKLTKSTQKISKFALLWYLLSNKLKIKSKFNVNIRPMPIKASIHQRTMTMYFFQLYKIDDIITKDAISSIYNVKKMIKRQQKHK